jgi:hypothetical protein
MQRYFPTVKDLIYSAIAAIYNHRFIKNPIVYSPIPDNRGNYQPVSINRYRTYDGKELIEPGLTLAIFPASSNRAESSSYTNNPPNSATFTPFEIGKKDSNYQYEGIYKFVVGLYYQEVAINETKDLIYYTLKNKPEVIIEDRDIARERKANLWDAKKLNIEINPGEDILRDYLDVLRLVIEELDVDGLLPWRVRGSQVTHFDFPTSSWSAKNENIYFHYAYLYWEISMYTPAIFKKDEKIFPVDTITLLKDRYYQ